MSSGFFRVGKNSSFAIFRCKSACANCKCAVCALAGLFTTGFYIKPEIRKKLTLNG